MPEPPSTVEADQPAMASLMGLLFLLTLVVRSPRAEGREILVVEKLVALVSRWLLSEPIPAPLSLHAG